MHIHIHSFGWLCSYIHYKPLYTFYINCGRLEMYKKYGYFLLSRISESKDVIFFHYGNFMLCYSQPYTLLSNCCVTSFKEKYSLFVTTQVKWRTLCNNLYTCLPFPPIAARKSKHTRRIAPISTEREYVRFQHK